MVFNSLEFFIFFPAVLLLYFLLPKLWDGRKEPSKLTVEYRWIMLLAASYYFYLTWNWQLIYLIVFTTVISFFCGLAVERTKKKAVKTVCLVTTLVVCLGILFFYKYFNFLSRTVAAVSGTDAVILDLILPVGISFYTFQTLSYVIDVYRGTMKAEKHFGYYALYVSFFPQLVAGPIERPENLLPQLKAQHKLESKNVFGGCRKMLLGFFKKIVVSDLLTVYIDRAYGDVAQSNGFGLLIATVLFAFRIYGDFSGYTDIAIGCSEVMGIRLMQNFDRPYIAKSIKEFWSRWHISLSSWFKDYIYIPLGGNRVSKARNCFNVMVVFLVSGLWHGADWTYVLWGAIHGVYQIIGKFTWKPRNRMWQKIGVNPDGRIVGAIRTFNTFLLADFAWIFFRAANLSDALTVIKKIFTDWQWNREFFTGTLDSLGLSLTAILTALCALLILALLDRRRLEPAEGRSEFSLRGAYMVWVIVIAWLILYATGESASAFIYFQF